MLIFCFDRSTAHAKLTAEARYFLYFPSAYLLFKMENDLIRLPFQEYDRSLRLVQKVSNDFCVDSSDNGPLYVVVFFFHKNLFQEVDIIPKYSQIFSIFFFSSRLAFYFFKSRFPRHGFNKTYNTVGIMEHPCRVQSCVLRFFKRDIFFLDAMLRTYIVKRYVFTTAICVKGVL